MAQISKPGWFGYFIGTRLAGLFLRAPPAVVVDAGIAHATALDAVVTIASRADAVVTRATGADGAVTSVTLLEWPV